MSDSDVLREVGSALRNQRLTLRRSLREAAQDLKIKESYLSAIEDGRADELPGKVYLRGFIRSYAGYLELDETHLWSSVEPGTRSNLVSESVPPPTPFSLSQSPSGLVLVVAGLVAIGAYAAWSYFFVPPTNFTQRTPEVPKEIVQAVKTTDVQKSEPALVASERLQISDRPENNAERLAKNRKNIGFDPVKKNTEKGLLAEPPDTKNGPKKEGDYNLRAVLKKNNHFKQNAQNSLSKPEKLLSTGAKSLSPDKAKKSQIGINRASEINKTDALEQTNKKKNSNSKLPIGRISIRGRVASWLEIKRKNGESLVSRMFRPSETFVLPRERGIMLSTGNAGGIEILLDGELIAPLGLNGSVRRNVLVEPRTLKHIIEKP